MATFEESLKEAIETSSPVQNLRTLALDLLARGQSRPAVLVAFEKARQRLRDAGREAEEDAVIEAMDFIVGWCSPHMKLPPDEEAAAKRDMR